MSAEHSAVALLGESDFLASMQGPCREWRQKEVQEGTFRATDGTQLQYYCVIPAEAKRNVVLLHGLCGFFGKYHEMMWILAQAGHAVFFMEHRGHGRSGGKLPEPDADMVYIDNYTTYVEDVHAFFQQVVVPRGEGRETTLFGHSMGGAIATLFLERYPEYCSTAEIGRAHV